MAAVLRHFATSFWSATATELNLSSLSRALPETSLFVFFNKVYKVLDKSFDRPSLLVARSGTSGANIVHRKEVKDVLQLLSGREAQKHRQHLCSTVRAF